MLRLLPVLLLATPALAGPPGSDEPVIAVGAGATLNSDARFPVGFILDGRAELPVGLHLRAEVSQHRFPDKDLEAFIIENSMTNDDTIAPDSVAWSVYEARLTAAWGLGEAQRESGLRARLGGLLIVGGSGGASSALEPLGWQADMTRFARFGPSASIGWALPFGDNPEDALLDVRLAGSLAVPIAAGGGALSSDYREDTLTVDGERFGAPGLIGRETRLNAEATLWLNAIMVSAELGLEHNPISRISAARAESENWDEADRSSKPAPHAALKVGLVF